MSAVDAPIGVVLAGGASRRLGRPKARATLLGEPMLSRPLRALREALGEAVVVAKPDSPLPDDLPAVVWHEPQLPRHPFCGVLAALARADGRPVLVCPVDLPFLTAAVIARLAAAPAADVALAVGPDGRLPQPLVGRYGPGAAATLADAARAGRPAGAALRALRPELVGFDDAQLFFNVNTAEDLAAAEARLTTRPGG